MYEDNEKQTRFAAFENWLTNMFWYHYKWYYIIGVFILSLIIMSAVSFIRDIDYDWIVVYAHTDESNPAKADLVRSKFEENGTDTTGNGRVQIDVKESVAHLKIGSYNLYGELAQADFIIYVMDDSLKNVYQSLGYFKDAAYSESLGLWVGIHDTPIKPYTLEDFAGYNYTQAEIDESNRYRQEDHEKLITQAEAIITKIG